MPPTAGYGHARSANNVLPSVPADAGGDGTEVNRRVVSGGIPAAQRNRREAKGGAGFGAAIAGSGVGALPRAARKPGECAPAFGKRDGGGSADNGGQNGRSGSRGSGQRFAAGGFGTGRARGNARGGIAGNERARAGVGGEAEAGIERERNDRQGDRANDE